MSKHIEFGKDLGLMVQVVNRGLSLGFGQWELWSPLSKPRSGLWSEMLQFSRVAIPKDMAEATSWSRVNSNARCSAPDVDLLDKVVREGREHDFGKREWQRLAEGWEFFQALVGYLRLAPPFSVPVEVNYDQTPPYIGGYTPLNYPKPSGKGVVRREMSIYAPHECLCFSDIETMLRRKNWRFADQNELYSFGQATKNAVRPWAIMGTEPIYGFGSRSESSGGYVGFPRLWTLRGNEELDPHGVCRIGKEGIRENFRLLIVKN